jgi:hypothetical protein
MAIGCIQAQQCHTGHCPTGVTAHDFKLQRGLVPKVQADRFAHYVSVPQRTDGAHARLRLPPSIRVHVGGCGDLDGRGAVRAARLEGYTPKRPHAPPSTYADASWSASPDF